MSNSTGSAVPKTEEEWKAALDALPATPEKIPAFFFGHGSPILQWPDSIADRMRRGPMGEYCGPDGPLARFLKTFGPTLLDKYKPKGILVFSAHWETRGERLVTDYGDNQPLLMDYFGFDPELYELKFVSRGSHDLSLRVVDAFKEAGHLARTVPVSEPRGQDGRGYAGPGLDHGVFVPFRIMFGHEFQDVPIVQASIDASLSPEKNWAVGKAVAKLREEGILILSGGLTVHSFADFEAFAEKTAKPIFKEFDQAISNAVLQPTPERKSALANLTKHRGFRRAHPREDHFVPLYIAAGAGEDGDARVLAGIYGSPTFAFGL
ncbi:Extradiol ring-cleavage dioxygenase, class III enzyme, subunit B [Phellopilus nigrolimitatus]|nr:Extradiol ring-cleavage dioxygenase, class III enzyme, subunit B [Phellopilus nigrolimitatus]